MTAKLVDSHCHLDRLDLSEYDGDLDRALDRAREEGVGHMLCVCIDRENYATVVELARRYPDVSASAGVHPNEPVGADEPDIDTLVEMASASGVVAVGETGLDYFRSEGDLEWQRERFRRHIAAAREVEKPLIIHSRAVEEDTVRILREEGADRVGGVMHCFVDDWDTAQRAMELGFYISFTGIVTFRNAKQVQDVASRVPAERMMVETDSPYLAPVPYRGKTNQPAYVRHVAEKLAELRETSVEAITEQTTENFRTLFRCA